MLKLVIFFGLDAIQEFVILRLVFSDGPKVNRVLGLELREHRDRWLVNMLVPAAHVGMHGILGIGPTHKMADVLQGCLLWLLPTRDVETEIVLLLLLRPSQRAMLHVDWQIPQT